MATLLSNKEVHAELLASAEPLHYEHAGECACAIECAVTTLEPRDVTCDDCIGSMVFRHLYGGNVELALFWSDLLVACNQRNMVEMD